MLNHSTRRLNDSTFRLNRRQTCQHRGEVGMLKAEHASIAAKLACWRRNMPASRRSWQVGGATCQDRGEAGKLEAQLARIVAKLASWRRNLPGSWRSWQVGGGTCQDRGVVIMGVKKISR